MNYQQTSLDAFKEINKPLSLGKKQEVVHKIIHMMQPCTNLMISRSLGWAINSVTPRVQELRKRGLVEESHRARDEMTGRTSIFWKESII